MEGRNSALLTAYCLAFLWGPLLRSEADAKESSVPVIVSRTDPVRNVEGNRKKLKLLRECSESEIAGTYDPPIFYILQGKDIPEGRLDVKHCVGAKQSIAAPASADPIETHRNYYLPYIILAIRDKQYIQRSVDASFEPRLDLGARATVLPPVEDQRRVVECLESLLPSAASRVRRSRGPSGLWTYRAFGSRDGAGYDPDLGVCSSVMFGFDAAMQLGLLDFQSDVFGTGRARSDLIGRLATSCAWTLVEFGGLCSDCKEEPDPECAHFDLRRYQVVLNSTYAANSSTNTVAVDSKVRKISVSYRPRPLTTLQYTGDLCPSPENGTNPYRLSSAGFSIVAAECVLARLLDRAPHGRPMGELQWSEHARAWRVDVRTVDGGSEPFYFQMSESPSDRTLLPLHVWRGNLSDGNEIPFDKANVAIVNKIVADLTTVSGKIRTLKDGGVPGSGRSSTYFSVYKYFCSLGLPYVVGDWFYYSDFCDEIPNGKKQIIAYVNPPDNGNYAGATMSMMLLEGDYLPLFPRQLSREGLNEK
jgi:hypothetical protein